MYIAWISSNNNISKIFVFFVIFIGCLHITFPIAWAVSVRSILFTLFFSQSFAFSHTVGACVCVCISTVLQTIRGYSSANKKWLSPSFYLYTYTTSSLKKNKNLPNDFNCLFFNNLGILIKMQAGPAIMHSSAAALAHEEGNMIRLSILESRKQWDLEGKFCKWIDIFQYVDLFQSKMNHLFNSLLIHLYWKKK